LRYHKPLYYIRDEQFLSLLFAEHFKIELARCNERGARFATPVTPKFQ